MGLTFIFITVILITNKYKLKDKEMEEQIKTYIQLEIAARTHSLEYNDTLGMNTTFKLYNEIQILKAIYNKIECFEYDAMVKIPEEVC
jgi:predicted solute-binding protein